MKENLETVGVAKNFVTYGEAIEHLKGGGIISRSGWNGKGMFVFKQIPSKVPNEYVGKMSSLPERVKEVFGSDVSPSYQNQMALVQPDGRIDSWVASSSDTFAEDWILD